MDLRTEFERAIEGMEWKELSSILEEVIQNLLGDTPDAPPPSSSPPAVLPAEPKFSSFLQPEGSHAKIINAPFGEVLYLPTSGVNSAPIILQSAHLSSQAGAHSQGQFFQIIPEENVLCSAQTLNDKESGEYVKKPPNAFMLFLKEQKPKFAAELNVKNSSTLNAILGEKWQSLSNQQQAKYYEQAELERRLHMQRHPKWSSKDNYGKKKEKRKKSKVPSRVEDTQLVKRLCVEPLRTEQPLYLTVLVEPKQTVWLPQTQINVPLVNIKSEQIQGFEVNDASDAVPSQTSDQSLRGQSCTL